MWVGGGDSGRSGDDDGDGCDGENRGGKDGEVEMRMMVVIVGGEA